MKKIVLATCLFWLFAGQGYAASIDTNTSQSVGIQQSSSNEKLIGLLRKNSQQAMIVIQLQQKIMQLEFRLSKSDERLRALEAIVYNNVKY